MEKKQRKVNSNKMYLTPDQEKFLIENFRSHTAKVLSEIMGMKMSKMRHFAYELGLHKMHLEYFTADQVSFIRNNYKWYGDVEIAEIFNQFEPKVKGWSKKHIEKKRRYLNLKRTAAEISEIKVRNIKMGRFAECAKKRWETVGSSEIGTVRIHKYNGGEVAAIKTDKGFVHRNRWLWQEHHGELRDDEIVTTVPGAPLICEIHHLRKITMAENAWRNHLSSSAIVKRKFKIKDTVKAKEFAEQNPDMIQVHRNLLILNRTLNERNGKN